MEVNFILFTNGICEYDSTVHTTSSTRDHTLIASCISDCSPWDMHATQISIQTILATDSTLKALPNSEIIQLMEHNFNLVYIPKPLELTMQFTLSFKTLSHVLRLE